MMLEYIIANVATCRSDRVGNSALPNRRERRLDEQDQKAGSALIGDLFAPFAEEPVRERIIDHHGFAFPEQDTQASHGDEACLFPLSIRHAFAAVQTPFLIDPIERDELNSKLGNKAACNGGLSRES